MAKLANADREAKKDYLSDDRHSIYRGHIGNLTDCDSSGIVIGMKVKGATRLGIDLDTIDEINHVNKGKEDEFDIDLPIELEDLEESNSANTHWDALVGITNRSGDLYESLSDDEKGFYYRYLMSRPKILGGEIRFVDYLEKNRIELNTVLATIKPQALWNWLRWKLLEIWPRRNYLRGGLRLSEDYIRTPTMKRFIDFYQEYTWAITRSRLVSERIELEIVDGMFDECEGFADSVPIVKKAIMSDVMDEVVLQDKKIQKMDLALEKIMKSKSKSKSEAVDEDEEEYDDNYDGNDWND